MSQRCRRRAEGIIYLTLFTYTARTTWDTASSPIEHFNNRFSLTDNNPTSPHLSCAIYYYLQNRIMACIPSDKKVPYSNLSATSPHNSPPPLKMCSITIELVTRRPCLLPVWWEGHGTGLKLIRTTSPHLHPGTKLPPIKKSPCSLSSPVLHPLMPDRYKSDRRLRWIKTKSMQLRKCVKEKILSKHTT